MSREERSSLHRFTARTSPSHARSTRRATTKNDDIPGGGGRAASLGTAERLAGHVECRRKCNGATQPTHLGLVEHLELREPPARPACTRVQDRRADGRVVEHALAYRERTAHSLSHWLPTVSRTPPTGQACQNSTGHWPDSSRLYLSAATAEIAKLSPSTFRVARARRPRGRWFLSAAMDSRTADARSLKAWSPPPRSSEDRVLHAKLTANHSSTILVASNHRLSERCRAL